MHTEHEIALQRLRRQVADLSHALVVLDPTPASALLLRVMAIEHPGQFHTLVLPATPRQRSYLHAIANRLQLPLTTIHMPGSPGTAARFRCVAALARQANAVALAGLTCDPAFASALATGRAVGIIFPLADAAIDAPTARALAAHLGLPPAPAAMPFRLHAGRNAVRLTSAA